MSLTETTTDVDGQVAHVNSDVGDRAPEGTVAIVGAGLGFNVKEAFVSRSDAVKLSRALTTAVRDHDHRERDRRAQERRERERRAAEARRLKRGDKVVGELGGRFTIVSDETASGRVDVVSLASGTLFTDRIARRLAREPVTPF